MDDLIPSECCDHKYYPTSQKLFENCCVFLKLSVVFQHPHCALSSLNACAEAQINLPVSSYRMPLPQLLLNHSHTWQFKSCLQRR